MRTINVFLITYALIGLMFLPVAIQAQSIVSDRAALKAFYQATGGKSPGWKVQIGLQGQQKAVMWDVDDPVSDMDNWEGVTVKNGRVTDLVLSNLGLIGTLPAALGQLTALETLNLSGNYQLGGTLPSELTNLTTLRVLKLNQIQLTGALLDVLRILSPLTQLEVLHLGYTSLTAESLPTLAGFSHLTSIDLSGISLTDASIPGEWKNLTSLHTIRLARTGLATVPNWLATRTTPALSASTYDVSDNHLTALPPGLEGAKEIAVRNNFLSFKDLIPYKTKLGAYGQLNGWKYQQNQAFQAWRAPASTTEIVPVHDDSHGSNTYTWYDAQQQVVANTKQYSPATDGLYAFTVTNSEIAGFLLGKYVYFNQNIVLIKDQYGNFLTPPLLVNPPSAVPKVLHGTVDVPLGSGMVLSLRPPARAQHQASVRFTITGGTLKIGTTNITFSGGNNGEGAFTAKGSLNDINIALASSSFTPTGGAANGKVHAIAKMGNIRSNEAILAFPILPDPGNALLSFSLPGQEAAHIDHDQHAITIAMPSVTDLSHPLAAQFTASPGATVTVGNSAQQTGSTTNNFGSPVTYKVTPASGTPQDWTVTVKKMSIDRAALVAFYKAIGGNAEAGWKKYDGNTRQRVPVTWAIDDFMSGVDSWEGVTVAPSSGRVTKLDLAGSGLSGAFPAVLGQLTALTHLSLKSNFNLNGALPQELSALTQLQMLDVSGTGLTGTLASVFTLLDPAKAQLTTLHLGRTSLTAPKSPPALTDFTSLTSIDLSNMSFEDASIPDAWQRFSTILLNETGLESVPDWLATRTSGPALASMTYDLGNNYLKALPAGLGGAKKITISHNFLSFTDLMPYKTKLGDPTTSFYVYRQRRSYQVWRAPTDGTVAITPTNDDNHSDNVYAWKGPEQQETWNPPVTQAIAATRAHSPTASGIYYINATNAGITGLQLQSRIYFNKRIAPFLLYSQQYNPKLLVNPPDAVPQVSSSAVGVPLGSGMELSLHSQAHAQYQVSVRFTITGGTLKIGNTNITFSGGNNGEAAFTAKGSLSDINAALANASFTPQGGSTTGKVHVIAKIGNIQSNEAILAFPISPTLKNFLSTDADLTGIKVGGQIGVKGNGTGTQLAPIPVTITGVAHGTSQTDLTLTLADNDLSDATGITVSPKANVKLASNAGATQVLFASGTPQTLVITAEDGSTKKYYQVTVTVEVAPVVAVTGVTLNKNEVTLMVGNTETLTATVAPANATNPAVTWSSSNPAVATVSDGLVTAVGAGDATMTATASGDHTATAQVKVAAPLSLEKVENALWVSPVPVAAQLQLRMKNSTTGRLVLRLSTPLGSQVWQHTAAKTGEVWQQTIDLSKVAAGVYMLEVIAEGQHWTRKVVKR